VGEPTLPIDSCLASAGVAAGPYLACQLAARVRTRLPVKGLNTIAFPKCSGMATLSFTCKHAMPAFTPQLQSITALWLVLILLSHRG